MTQKRTPPPPPNRRGREMDVNGWLAKWESKIPGLARRVWHPERRGFSAQDVEQELRIAIMLACRHREAVGQPMNDGYINRVLRNTLISIGRSTRTQKVATINEDGAYQSAASLDAVVGENSGTLGDQLASALPRPDEAKEAIERDEGLSGLVYLLRSQLSPATFAMLHLRFSEEWTPETMAALLGYSAIEEWTCVNCGKHSSNPTARCCAKSNRSLKPIGADATGRISQTLSRAKAEAVTFLATIGVLTMDDAERVR